MKFILVFIALIAVALARPEAEILRYDTDVQPDSFKFSVATNDGFNHDAEGKLKDIGSDHEAIVVHGSYTWKDEKTGEVFTVNYVADENGFQPQGAHLPSA